MSICVRNILTVMTLGGVASMKHKRMTRAMKEAAGMTKPTLSKIERKRAREAKSDMPRLGDLLSEEQRLRLEANG